MSVPHASFGLRFSDLQEVENACREDDEERAIRTIDWMTSRINERCSNWVHDIESQGEKEPARTPWWDELRRCAEGDFVPSKTEGWNHPVARAFIIRICFLYSLIMYDSHTCCLNRCGEPSAGNHSTSFKSQPITSLGGHELLTLHLDYSPAKFTLVWRRVGGLFLSYQNSLTQTYRFSLGQGRFIML